jgi:hypothetical protein
MCPVSISPIGLVMKYHTLAYTLPELPKPGLGQLAVVFFKILIKKINLLDMYVEWSILF